MSLEKNSALRPTPSPAPKRVTSSPVEMLTPSEIASLRHEAMQDLAWLKEQRAGEKRVSPHKAA